ncbi:MAG TPA: hypothetical protein VNE39_17740 [Planctomycetota bacterium]|nr:hypothetical protein [Planctomycetota bacterium]
MPCDLFISHSRRDNAQGRISELVERIKADFAAFIASVRNWRRMSRARASTAVRSPILRVRSVTDIDPSRTHCSENPMPRGPAAVGAFVDGRAEGCGKEAIVAKLEA